MGPLDPMNLCLMSILTPGPNSKSLKFDVVPVEPPDTETHLVASAQYGL